MDAVDKNETNNICNFLDSPRCHHLGHPEHGGKVRTYTKEELAEILEKHKKWLQGLADGERADLSSADLSYADLSYADLSYADLSYANLRYANLRYADLSSANLSSANLRYADLRYANLRYAEGVDLQYVDYSITPEAGAFTAYKKVWTGPTSSGLPIVLTLEIPASAKRTSNLLNRKCRASEAMPIAAENLDGTPAEGTVFYAAHDSSVWEIGKLRTVDNFDDSPLVDCAPGLHFFITKKEARNY